MTRIFAALVAEHDALTAEVARLSTPPDDVETAKLVAELGEPLVIIEGYSADYVDTDDVGERMGKAADALTRLSHALAAETAKREAMEEALAKVAGFQGRFKMPFPEAHEEYPAYVVVLARETLAKHGSK